MTSELRVKGFRGFQDYRVGGLRRVNLLVGKNNSGKTSLLEAMYCLGIHGHPATYAILAYLRGEIVYVPKDKAFKPDISHFFHGHRLQPQTRMEISHTDFGELRAWVELISEDATQMKLFGEAVGPVLELRIQHNESLGQFTLVGMRLNGLLDPVSISALLPLWEEAEGIAQGNIQFLSTGSLQSISVTRMWDRAILEGREEEVVQAMRVLEPSLSKVFFLSTNPGIRDDGVGGIVVSLSGDNSRVPLGSFGEGMRRMLALALSLVQTSGGMLLVDEIDTGLHYSVLADMWRLVIETAIRSNVTVMATTHSRDCVAGLAEVCERYPELGEEVSLQKIDARLPESVALDAAEIVIAANSGIEVR